MYQAAMTHFAEAFERRTRFEAALDQVEDILREDAHRARAKTREVVERVRSACSLTAKPV
jgi:hypothetical protein